MPYGDLFGWWALVITAGIVFTTLISIFLYVRSKSRNKKKKKIVSGIYRIGIDFIFVWIILSLLVLYIVSIGRLSIIIFASGNLVVEAILIVYLFRNATKETNETLK